MGKNRPFGGGVLPASPRPLLARRVFFAGRRLRFCRLTVRQWRRLRASSFRRGMTLRDFHFHGASASGRTSLSLLSRRQTDRPPDKRAIQRTGSAQRGELGNHSDAGFGHFRPDLSDVGDRPRAGPEDRPSRHRLDRRRRHAGLRRDRYGRRGASRRLQHDRVAVRHDGRGGRTSSSGRVFHAGDRTARRTFLRARGRCWP